MWGMRHSDMISNLGTVCHYDGFLGIDALCVDVRTAGHLLEFPEPVRTAMDER